MLSTYYSNKVVNLKQYIGYREPGCIYMGGEKRHVDCRSSPPTVHGPTQCTPKSKNTKNSTLSYAIKMDSINATFAALELQDPPNYT